MKEVLYLLLALSLFFLDEKYKKKKEALAHEYIVKMAELKKKYAELLKEF